jgi:zinc protease
VKFVRTLACLFAGLVLSAPALAQAPTAPLKQPGKWAQDYLGRPADPDVRFGTLPNGLRYAIQKNDTPKGAVSMRMLIGSGSLKERVEERGLAHFLEHMAFRGSTNVPDGEVIHMLERLGLRFGPDTNASTSFDRTLYMFNFPTASTEAVDTGLKLFREIGERLKLDPAAVEAEKGVVLSEERLRDTPPLKASKVNLGQLFAGTLVPDRWPIGEVETIQGATSERLRRYYRANYRPNNATIVVVGAVDPAETEAKIKAGFSDWANDAAADVYTAATPSAAVRAAEFVADGAPDQLSVSWMRPLDRRAETLDVDREHLRRLLAFAVFNNRLGDAALKPGSPFTAASASVTDDYLDTGAMVSIGIQSDPAKWQDALQTVLTEQRVLLRDGVSADELKRASNGLLARMQAIADGASTRRDEALADGIVQTALDDDLYTSPAQDLALTREVFAGETPQSVTAALRTTFSAAQPLVFRSARAQPATPAGLEAGLASALARPLPEAQARAAATWPYTDFGKPGAVVSRREDAELRATIVTFANGTRLVFRHSDLEKDRVSVSIGFGTGEIGLAPALAHANWAVGLFTAGGMGKLTVPDLRNYMQTQGKLAGVSGNFGITRFWLSGGTRPADFAFQMQLLAAFTTDPGFRPEMADQLKAVAPMQKTQIDANAGAVFQRGVVDLVQGNDRRFAGIPSDADIDATQPGDLPAILKPQLGAPADVSIVGDITVDQAIEATAATFGAMPRGARPAESRATVAMAAPRAEPFVFRHGGRADQAYYGLIWKLPDFYTDQKLAHVADVAAALIKARLVDTVREKLGLTYSPSAAAYASPELSGLGYFIVQNETPPDKFAQLRGAVLDVIASVARDPITPDELDRARKPLVEAAQKERETNGFWVQNLATVLRDPRMRGEVLNEPAIIGAVTAADVKALLARYVTGKMPLTAISQAK